MRRQLEWLIHRSRNDPVGPVTQELRAHCRHPLTSRDIVLKGYTAQRRTPMRYMLMLYADENGGAQIPPDQMAKAMDTMFAYQDALTKAGAFVMTSPLARTRDARTIRMEGGEVHTHE